MSPDLSITVSLDSTSVAALADAIASRLRIQRPDDASDDDLWMDSKQAAAYLGLPSVHALHKLTAARALPFSQRTPRGRMYFKRSELDDWRGA